MKQKLALSLVLSGMLCSGFAFNSVASANSQQASSNQGYYRAPHLVDNHVVFTAEGDIWMTDLHASPPRRLTSSEAEETNAKLSPDGTTVAFVANYDGAPEVYVMPVQGGTPKRVTFEQNRVRLQAWTPQGELLYSTDHVMGPANQWVLKKVQPETLNTETIPLADAVEGVTDAQGKQLFFTRFGLQYSGDNARFYRGGAKGEIWSYTLGSNEEATHLTEGHEGNVRKPMYWQGRVYFISDADGSPNIWSASEQGGDFKQHTQLEEWQVWDASLSQGRIVFQQGADLYQLNLATEQTSLLQIELASDFRQRQERWLNAPLDYVTHISFSGANEGQVAITARSQIAIAAKGPRRLVEVQTPEISRSRNAVISNDGKWVYAINDQSGENEIWQFAADGSKQAKRLTTDGDNFRWGLYLSPDNRYLAHDDKNGHIYLLDLKTNKNTLIYKENNKHSSTPVITWSPDSELLAFARTDNEGSRTQVILYSIADNKHQVITSNKYESFSPSFSQDGLWLYFISERNFVANPGSPWGDRNMGPAFNNRGEIYAVSLKEQACFPFAAPTEITSCNDKTATADAKKKSKRVDWNGLTSRLWQVPVEAGSYYNLNATKGGLLFQAGNWQNSNLIAVDFAKTDVEKRTYASNIRYYTVSGDKKHALVQQRRASNIYVVDLDNEYKSTKIFDKKNLVNASQWRLNLNPQQEWQQMFHDAWLMHRDFLFDSNMRGVDWKAKYDQYQPLLARLTDRFELDDLFSQLLSELSVLHSQVRGGEYPDRSDKPSSGSLGAQYKQHAKGLEVTYIYQYDPEVPSRAAPLAKPGVNISVGDVITHVNGKAVKHLGELSTALRSQTGKQVRLDVTRGKNTWATVVIPASVGEDHRLRYNDWVHRNRAYVEKVSDGEYGYLHLYAMGAGDIADFAREFYNNVDKKGLVIDVRRNRGGNIDSFVLEKLLRRVWEFWQPPYGSPYGNMQDTFRGQLVVLADEMTYSDGETFTAGIRTLGLAPVIGRRTAGAGVWLSGRNTLADKGLARVAETAQHALDGVWTVEGYGVEPDIEVRNLPHATFIGYDAQLDRGLKELEQLLKDNPYLEFKAKPLSAPYAADAVNR